MTTLKNRMRGFTLVEIAIVLVIIGLLLGGVLKGQELINNAKIRSIADRQNSLKSAWFAFIDRYSGLPGDYPLAVRYIDGVLGDGAGDGLITEVEAPLVLHHLTAAGYIRCAVCTASSTVETSSQLNSLVNQYGGVISIWADGINYAAQGGLSTSPRLMIHTGPRIPSNIIYEVDKKIDDGTAAGGDMRFNQHDPTIGGGAIGPTAKIDNTSVQRCTTISADSAAATPTTADGTISPTAGQNLDWRPAGTQGIESNCGASIFI